MNALTAAERELVALGAALAANCVPCTEYHIPAARKAGLTDGQIDEAIRLADDVRQVPARKVLATALSKLEPGAEPAASAASATSAAGGCPCSEPSMAGAGALASCA